MNTEFNCKDCQENTLEIEEYYMVHDHVWLLAHAYEYKFTRIYGGYFYIVATGMLCVGCLETRLTPQDFTDCPLNNDPSQAKSHRLRVRLGVSSPLKTTWTLSIQNAVEFRNHWYNTKK